MEIILQLLLVISAYLWLRDWYRKPKPMHVRNLDDWMHEREAHEYERCLAAGWDDKKETIDEFQYRELIS